MTIEIEPWDTAENLDSPEQIAAYLEVVFEDGDPQAVALAIANVARAKALPELASNAGVTRDALYKALTEHGDPRLSTFVGVMKALGLKIVAEPA